MKISIVRHGETDSNKSKKLMGSRMDEHLNSEGIKQAHELADSIKENDFDIIFTSPLKRASQTAEIIAKKINVLVVERKELIERDFGSLTGKSWEEMMREIRSGSSDLKAIDFEQKYDYRPYGGECSEDVEKRLLEFTHDLKARYSDKKVLIVAHGGIIKLAHLLFLEKKMDKTPDNATIHDFNI